MVHVELCRQCLNEGRTGGSANTWRTQLLWLHVAITVADVCAYDMQLRVSILGVLGDAASLRFDLVQERYVLSPCPHTHDTCVVAVCCLLT